MRVFIRIISMHSYIGIALREAMNKTKKALIKRFKITGTGKILRRLSGQNHYRAKKTGQMRRNGRKWIQLSKSETKRVKRYLQS